MTAASIAAPKSGICVHLTAPAWLTSPCAAVSMVLRPEAFTNACTHAAGVGANLLLGSRTANSQLVSLPAALLNRPADWSASQLSADQPHTSWQASASVTVQKPAVIDSAAAIHAACVFQEPKGMLQGHCNVMSLLCEVGRPSSAQLHCAQCWLQ